LIFKALWGMNQPCPQAGRRLRGGVQWLWES